MGSRVGKGKEKSGPQEYQAGGKKKFEKKKRKKGEPESQPKALLEGGGGTWRNLCWGGQSKGRGEMPLLPLTS